MGSTSEGIQRVAILAPMRSELEPLAKLLDLTPATGRDPGLLWGAAGGVEVVAMLTGIGMRAGAQAAERVLDALSPDHLVVVGIAGGIGESVAIGDLIVPERVMNLETGEQFQPSPLGVARPRGTLASSDALLEAPDEARSLSGRGVIAIDMETAAIAGVCERRGCPWSVFQAVSDRADDGSTDAMVLGLVDPEGNPKLGAVARFVLTRPQRIPQLVRLARGANAATGAAARAAFEALHPG